MFLFGQNFSNFNNNNIVVSMRFVIQILGKNWFQVYMICKNLIYHSLFNQLSQKLIQSADLLITIVTDVRPKEI